MLSLVDLGCGSRRAAKGISKRVKIGYLGTDVVKRLLDYAATVCPPQPIRTPLDKRLVLTAPEIRRVPEPPVMPQIFPRTSSGE